MARFLNDPPILIQHIPRTGGTWIQRAVEMLYADDEYARVLRGGDLATNCRSWHPTWAPKKHCLLHHYYAGRIPPDATIACFVRHPLAYYESTWRYLARIGRAKRLHICQSRKWPWHPQREPSDKWLPDFNAWAVRMTEEVPGWATRLFEAYTGPRGAEICSFIGRTETLAEDFAELLLAHGHENRDAAVVKSISPQNAAPDPKVEWETLAMAAVLRSECVAVDRWYGASTINRRVYRVANAPGVAAETALA